MVLKNRRRALLLARWSFALLTLSRVCTTHCLVQFPHWVSSFDDLVMDITRGPASRCYLAFFASSSSDRCGAGSRHGRCDRDGSDLTSLVYLDWTSSVSWTGGVFVHNLLMMRRHSSVLPFMLPSGVRSSYGTWRPPVIHYNDGGSPRHFAAFLQSRSLRSQFLLQFTCPTPAWARFLLICRDRSTLVRHSLPSARRASQSHLSDLPFGSISAGAG